MTPDAFAAELEAHAAAVESATDEAVRLVAERTADIQRDRTLVDTGATRESIRADRVAPGHWSVGPAAEANSAPTDVHQEFGTPTLPANPFVAPSADFAEQALSVALGEVIETSW